MSQNTLKLMVIPGDGIGPEVMEETLKILHGVLPQENVTLEMTTGLAGGCSLDAHGIPLTEETVQKALQSDAVLLGAVGGPRWDTLPHAKRPERALLGLRSKLGLFANLRPAKIIPALAEASTLKPEVVNGIDLLVVRELTGGLYFGTPRGQEGEGENRRAFNTLVYSVPEIRRIMKTAFESARLRRKKVCSVDKANVLESSILWREIAEDTAKKYADVSLESMYVDNCCMQLVRNPRQFDVIVTTNMFGDIISDEASMLTGSIGMLPSASVGADKNRFGFPRGMYEPVHGSAPDIAGKGVANPLATILSAAMMLRYSFGFEKAAMTIENAVEAVLNDGFRTGDLEGGKTRLGTREMGNKVLEYLGTSKK